MTRLYDSLFANQGCLHASGDNIGRVPEVVHWRREGPPGRNAWFTDSNLHEAKEVEADFKVAWLLEPRELRISAYEFIEKNPKLFDTVLTYDAAFLRNGRGPILPYFFGGARINPRDWDTEYNKSSMVSLVASPKRTTVGHRLRHYASVIPKIDMYGSEYEPIERKIHALSPYRFTVAIENCRLNWWFTEALIDPMLTGTVPIYWGCPDIGKLFNADGIIQVSNLSDIKQAVASATPDLYESMRPAIEDNFLRAQRYQLTEDLLYRTYPGLFDEIGSCI